MKQIGNISEKTLKTLLIIMMISSIPSLNVLGIIVSAFSFYGLKKKDIKMIKIMILPFFFDFFLIFGLFIVFIITDVKLFKFHKHHGDVLWDNKYLMIIYTLLMGIIPPFQLYTIIGLIKYVNNSYLNKTENNEYNKLDDDIENIQIINVSTSIPYPETNLIPNTNYLTSNYNQNYLSTSA
ncbi:hypothetical protein BCR32DRAFT_284662 [Anaeromyces robustus]|uniref:Uncharacterized protein n=1 Tax=Anaeromyces robustus TaxID=1754192 RepID=A0A1Y1WRW4_9FUNG|nr:hypothetical protein BCR32DRAFT_284662 [Anaeromyces robustus]|eukprot:ORX76008.1 hypothetical protein BCR32DRAFT_284662 [Anaeromyces robustus]